MITHRARQWQTLTTRWLATRILGYSTQSGFIQQSRMGSDPTIMESNKKIRLKIPTQDLSEFELFPANAAAALGWAQALPVANTDAVVELLSQALGALNRVQLAPESRYDIMEILRPNLDVALSNLAKRYLNQPLVLPAEPQRAADLAGKLYSMASTAYTIVAIEAIAQRDAIRETNPARLTCQAIQRALVFAGGKVLRTFQLFRPLEIHAWQALHQLYALADHHQLADLPVPEPGSGGLTIKATYLQALLLGCCKPNHLRQNDLAQLYRGLQELSALVQLETSQGDSGLFLVDLDSDLPPVYSAVYNEQRRDGCRYINTNALIAQLKSLRGDGGANSSEWDTAVGPSLPPKLLDHLIASLGSTNLRNFTRSASNSEMLVCIGLSSTHYYAAGETAFEQLLYGHDHTPTAAERVAGNQFLQHPQGDVWQQANPEEDSAGQSDDSERLPEAEVEHLVGVEDVIRAELMFGDSGDIPERERYPAFKVKLADASPGGYCLEWRAELPADIKSGDIVGLKEDVNGDWAIAVIRWLNQFEGGKTLIGLELLSPRATPYGASIHRKTGENIPAMRVLLLPAIKLVGQAHTLVTPGTGFKEGQKVTLSNKAEVCLIQLQRQVASSGSFTQFDFRYIKELGDLLAGQEEVKLHTGYDSVWSKI